jgi:hypothetical protein
MSKMSSIADTMPNFRNIRTPMSGTRSVWEESSTALNSTAGGNSNTTSARNRLFSASSEGQQRRVVRAAAEASKKAADMEVYKNGGGGLIGWYTRCMKLVENNHKSSTTMTIIYCLQIVGLRSLCLSEENSKRANHCLKFCIVPGRQFNRYHGSTTPSELRKSILIYHSNHLQLLLLVLQKQ